MLWLFFALATAFFESLKDLFAKKAVGEHNSYLVAWSATLCALPLVAFPVFGNSMPEWSSPLFGTLLLSCSLHLAAIVLYIKALELSPMSLTLPMISFTPAFMLLTSPLLIGEFPGAAGALGVCAIVSGAYLVNVEGTGESFFAPLRALMRERGPLYMLAVAFLWSITGNLDRIGLRYAERSWWLLLLIAGIALLMAPVVLIRARSALKEQYRYLFTTGLAVGVFNGLSMVMYMQAISLTLVAYVVSIKRLSILLGIVWGYLIFHEENIRQRLLGSAVMLAGLFLISLSG